MLFEKGASLDVKDDQMMTLLHIAASCGHQTTARVLLENGVDVDPKDNAGNTPPNLAAQNCQDEMMAPLLEHGANITSVAEQIQPLHIPLQRGWTPTAKLLLNMGTNINYRNPNTGYTALHLVAWRNRVGLLDEGNEEMNKACRSPAQATNDAPKPLIECHNIHLK